jgi:DNA mismatch repair protein MutS
MKIYIWRAALAATVLAHCATLAATPKTQSATESNSFKSVIDKVSGLYLPSLTAQEALEQAERANIQSHNTKQIEAKKITKIEEFFGPIAQLRTAYAVHNATPYGTDFSDKKVTLPESTLGDLTLFCGDKDTPERHVFDSLNRTQTISGLISLQTILAQPTISQSKLKSRQDFAKLLIKDTDLYHYLRTTLADIKKSEADFLSIMREMETEIEKYYQDVFFTASMLKGLNSQSSFMHGGTYMLAGREFFQKVTTDLIAASALGCLSFIEGAPSFINLFSNYYAMVYGYHAFDPRMSTQMRVFSGIMGGLNVYTLGSGLHQFSNRLPIVAKLKEKMMGVANVLITTHRELAQTLIIHPQALTVLPEIEANVLGNLSQQESRKIVTVLENLHDNSMKAGHAVAAFERKDEIKENFADSYKFLGLIDAYVSIATLMKEGEESDNGRYCFVDYVDSKTPVIDFADFWHPMIDPEKVVLNNIYLGDTRPANAIITGPNAGGKTTTLRSIGVSVLMGQTLGIVPATKAKLSPFSNFATYLNVADSEGKESLFQAEMRRAQNLLNAIKKLSPSELSFVIMDEIFTGTNPQEGAAGAYGIAKKLSSYTNSSVLMTTHFVDLTSLADETKRFSNYKVTVKQVGKKFEFPYKLEHGITDQAIALQLLDQEGFDSEILDDAKEYMARKKAK